MERGIADLRLGVVIALVVCDDWMVVARERADCEAAWRLIMQILLALGFAFAAHKCQGPRQLMKWLGLLYNSVEMTVALPEEKVLKAAELIVRTSEAQKVSRRDLDRLFGYLSFCCSVVFGGRAFLHGVRRLRYRSDGTVRGAGHHVHVNKALKEDMRSGWWAHHLRALNGDRGTPIVSPFIAHEDLQITLDARGGSGGVGVFVDGAFVGLTGAEVNAAYPAGRGAGAGGWAEIASPGVRRTLSCGTVAEPSEEANHWELFAFVVLLDRFPDVLRNRHVVVMSDSATAIRCVRNFGAALDSPVLAHLTRCVLSLCVELNTRLLPLHVPGVENVLADPLSRGEWAAFGAAARRWAQPRVGNRELTYFRNLEHGA